MLNTLRRIDWPEDIQPSGGVLKGEVLGQVSDYETLIRIARSRAERIRKDQERQAKHEAEVVRKQVANSVKTDLAKFQEIFLKQRDQILDKSAEICTEVTKAAVTNFLGSVDDEKKIKRMIQLLIDRMHSRSEIEFGVHPKRVELVKEVLVTHFHSVLRTGSYFVEEDGTLDLDQIRIKTANNAYVDVSLKNIVAVMGNELESMESLIKKELSAECQFTESVQRPQGGSKSSGLVGVSA